jgi:VIT1/CCC1 family predicted Fe2+/Mn2+ transporter
MREDHKQARLMAAHQTQASKHPGREIFMHRLRPVLVPVLGVAVVLAVVVFAARKVAGAVSPGLLVAAGVVVLAVLVGVGLVLGRSRNGIPRSWSKYM